MSNHKAHPSQHEAEREEGHRGDGRCRVQLCGPQTWAGTTALWGLLTSNIPGQWPPWGIPWVWEGSKKLPRVQAAQPSGGCGVLAALREGML